MLPTEELLEVMQAWDESDFKKTDYCHQIGLGPQRSSYWKLRPVTLHRRWGTGRKISSNLGKGMHRRRGFTKEVIQRHRGEKSQLKLKQL